MKKVILVLFAGILVLGAMACSSGNNGSFNPGGMFDVDDPTVGPEGQDPGDIDGDGGDGDDPGDTSDADFGDRFGSRWGDRSGGDGGDDDDDDDDAV